jgi:hypothetical protein
MSMRLCSGFPLLLSALSGQFVSLCFSSALASNADKAQPVSMPPCIDFKRTHDLRLITWRGRTKPVIEWSLTIWDHIANVATYYSETNDSTGYYRAQR